MILKQSTAYAHKFLMVLSSDHITGATGKTIAVELSKGPNAAGTAAAGAVTELDSSNLPGVYQIVFTVADVSVQGDLWLHAAGSGCDPTDECHQVQTTIFTDLLLDGSGRALIASNYKQNQPTSLPFAMTVGDPPIATPGLAPTGQRNFGSGFSPIAGTITDLGNGCYSAALLAADTNAPAILYRFSSLIPNANDQDITVYTQP